MYRPAFFWDHLELDALTGIQGVSRDLPEVRCIESTDLDTWNLSAEIVGY
jgi:hypothetical protein